MLRRAYPLRALLNQALPPFDDDAGRNRPEEEPGDRVLREQRHIWAVIKSATARIPAALG